eukprot:6155181-Pyramimonas_sp.AAC.1
MESDNQRAEHLFWLLQQAKRRWGGGSRENQRVVLGGGYGGASKEKVKVNGVAFLQRLSDDQYVEIFFGGKGRGEGRRDTSGKGRGRRGNPRCRDGQILKCHECDSTDHLVEDCPAKGNGNGSSTEVHFGSSERFNEYLSLQDFEALEHAFYTWVSCMDNVDELE